MTPATIIQDAATDGVILAITATGTIKASGEKAAVNRWLPMIREHKPEILAALKLQQQQEARRQKVLAMLDADPTLKRAIYADSDSDPDNVILAIAVRHVATCEMLISKSKFDPMRLLELIDAQTTH